MKKSKSKGNSYESEAEHCHRNNRDFSSSTQKAKRKLIIASVLCVIFMITEVIGGILSGSLAIATDAAHLLSDLGGFLISLFALWVGQKPPNAHMLFGWHRAEVIGAFLSVLIIWLITGILVYMATLRIVNADYEIDAVIMLIAAGIGVAVNVLMASALHQSSHKHDHEIHQNDSEVSVLHSSERENINVRAALIHVIGDIIQSIGVLIAAIVIYFKPEWGIIDPICTFLFSVLVLLTTYHILKDILIVLMEGAPRGTNIRRVINVLMGIEGVVGIHNIRAWALSLDKTALSAHLVINPAYNSNDILNSANALVHRKFSFFEHTIQVEPYKPTMTNCLLCKQFET